MSEQEGALDGADNDRRRFLILATKLGVSVPPVVTLALARRSYAAGSGFTGETGTGSSGGGSSGSSGGGNNTRDPVVLRRGDVDHDHSHHRN